MKIAAFKHFALNTSLRNMFIIKIERGKRIDGFDEVGSKVCQVGRLRRSCSMVCLKMKPYLTATILQWHV